MSTLNSRLPCVGQETPNSTPELDRVHAVATQMLLSQSHSSVSLKEIAVSAGVPPGSMHKLTGGREGLLLQLIDGYESGLLSALLSEVSNSLAATPALNRYVACYLEYGVTHRDRHHLAKQEVHNLQEEGQASLRALKDKQVNKLWEVIAVGNAKKTFDSPDLRLTAKIIIASLDGLLSNKTVSAAQITESIPLLQRMAARFLSASRG